MRTATPLTAAIALLALAACGEETSSDAAPPAQKRSVEAPAPDPAKAAAVAEVAPVAEPEPEPVDVAIAFRGEDGELALERDALRMVSPVHDAQNDVWSVFVQMDKEAAEAFYDLTTRTTGEALAIVVEDMVVATPVLETPVYGGGFVFDVDDGDTASAVVATLSGREPQAAAPREIVADAAIPATDAPDAGTDVADAATEAAAD